MRQRPDRRLAVLLEVEVPAVLQERGKLGLAVVGQDRPAERQPGDRSRNEPPEPQCPALGRE